MSESSEVMKRTQMPFSMRLWKFLFLFFSLILFLVLFFGLEQFPGLNGDEAYQGLLSSPVGEGKQHGSILWRSLTTKAPSGRYPHPLLISSIHLAERVAPPSAWTLRFPVALWSLLACVLLFFFSRRLKIVFSDELSPWYFLILFASHPLFLGYARFAWEPSLYAVGVVCFWMPWFWGRVYRERPLFWFLVGVGALLCLLAHPVYLVFLLCALSVLWWFPEASKDSQEASKDLQEASKDSQNLQSLSLKARKVRLFLTALWLVFLLLGWGFFLSKFQPAILWSFFWGYVWNLVEILSGVRIFQYITGTSWGLWHTVVLTSSVLLWSVVCVVLFLRRRVFLGYFANLFFLVMQSYFFLQPFLPLHVGQERYLLVLLFPFTFFLALGIQQLSLYWGRLVLFSHASICLLSFVMGYFVEGWRSENQRAHPSFWVGSSLGDAEPKAKIIGWIKARVPYDTPIYTSSFWMEKPLAYGLQRPIKAYWEEGKVHFGTIPWGSMRDWVVVDFHLRAAPLWSLLRYFERQKIPYQMFRVQSKRGRTQAWIVTPRR